jgi:LAS superfamily LD-carboxypeptidase LdcB
MEERQINPYKLCALIAFLISIIILIATCNKKEEKPKDTKPTSSNSTTSQSVPVTIPVVTADVSEKTYAVSDSDVFRGDLLLVNSQYPIQVTGTEEEIKTALNLKNVYENKGQVSYIHTAFNTIELAQPALIAFGNLMSEYHKVNNSDDILIREGYNGEDKTLDFSTGLSVDIKLQEMFNNSTKYYYEASKKQWFMWITDHAADYGFIVRYSADKSAVTGHEGSDSIFRYVGVAHAKYMVENNLSLEEYISVIQARTLSNPLQITVSNNAGSTNYTVYYVSKADAAGEIKYSTSNINVSGDNSGGFIVTTWNEIPQTTPETIEPIVQ